MLVGALVQVTVLPAVLPATFRPDVVLAMAITWGALASFRQAVPLAVLGGYLVDIWTDGPVGLTALLAGTVAFATAIGETPLVPTTIAFPLVLTFGAEIVLQAEAGVQGRVLSCKDAWCRLEIGGRRGWLPRAQLWGVYGNETVE